ncbi:MAG TPA: flavin reductase family protein [Bacteroidetes bacterium]|nr:flavin reductase family protein [Bacteroidota bacterium]
MDSNQFNTYDPKELSVPQLHGLLLGAVAPRPIAFASTMDKDGRPNLAPFSFFNVFSANPPIMIFSPARRVRNNTNKHTLDNCKNTGEVVINIVSHDIVEHMSLASTEYDAGVNEFIKSGLTMLDSDNVKPYRVAESPAHFECKVNDIIELGNEGGAGNLIICEVLKLHVRSDVFNEAGKIDPYKIDVVSRMGGDFYCRANADSIFKVEKPNVKKGIGIDQMPESIRNSDVFSGNQLAKLANIEQLPEKTSLPSLDIAPNELQVLNTLDEEDLENNLHQLASVYLDQNKLELAWKILLSNKT